MEANFTNLFIKLINEEITFSLPSDPIQIFKKIKIAFPNLFKTLGAVKSTLHKEANEIKITCKNFVLFIKRSSMNYNKLEISAKQGENFIFKSKSCFFEDLERTLTTNLKNLITEEEKLNKSSDSAKTLGGVLSTSLKNDSDEEVIGAVASLKTKYSDVDKVIKKPDFRKAMDQKTFSKVKKASEKLKKL